LLQFKKAEETNNQKVKSNKSEGEKHTNINPPERTLIKQLITSYLLECVFGLYGKDKWLICFYNDCFVSKSEFVYIRNEKRHLNNFTLNKHGVYLKVLVNCSCLFK